MRSLYGDTQKPTPEMLEDVDVLIFDIQDVGVRYYTYIWTLYYAMEAAGENDKRFIVLDRPNPLGPDIEGFLLEPELSSFVGLREIPRPTASPSASSPRCSTASSSTRPWTSRSSR